jgi:hypothetical protein
VRVSHLAQGSIARARVGILLIGLLFEVFLLLYFLRQFPLLRYYRGDIDMGGITAHSHLGFLQFIGVVSILFALFGVAWMLTTGTADRVSLMLILGFAALFALTLAFVYPITAIDLYAYVDESLVLVQYHHNPIVTTPSAFSSDPLMGLSGMWAGSASPYGPLGVVIDAIPALIFGRNLLANLIMLKLMFGAMAIAEAYTVYVIIRRYRPAWALSGALLVAWNPLILFEVGINGHNDIAMLLFAILGIASIAEDELTLGPVLLVASVLVKYTTIVLLPLVLLYAYFRKPPEDRIRYLAVTGLSCLAVAVVGYFPFWAGFGVLTHLLGQDQRHLTSLSTVLPGLLPAVSVSIATLAGRVLFIPIYGFCLWLATRDFENLLRGCFVSMFALLALAVTNFESWYVIWPVILGAAVPRRAERLSMVLMSYGSVLLASFFGYLWVWSGLSSQGFTTADTLSYLLIFVPAGVALVLLNWPRRVESVALGDGDLSEAVSV